MPGIAAIWAAIVSFVSRQWALLMGSVILKRAAVDAVVPLTIMGLSTTLGEVIASNADEKLYELILGMSTTGSDAQTLVESAAAHWAVDSLDGINISGIMYMINQVLPINVIIDIGVSLLIAYFGLTYAAFIRDAASRAGYRSGKASANQRSYSRGG